MELFLRKPPDIFSGTSGGGGEGLMGISLVAHLGGGGSWEYLNGTSGGLMGISLVYLFSHWIYEDTL